jgi:hypothetical protein
MMCTKERLSNLYLGMICDVRKPHADYPILKAKAAKTRHLIPILCQVAKDMCTGSRMSRHRVAALEHLTGFYTTCDQEPMFMSTPSAERAHKHIENCLHHYLWMHESAWVHNKWYCLPVPKVHYSWHLGYSARFMNPRFCWTYKAESWVGKLSHIASSCAFGVKSARLTVPFSEKYRYFVHVRLARQVLE